jgi:hypothetical protein
MESITEAGVLARAVATLPAARAGPIDHPVNREDRPTQAGVGQGVGQARARLCGLDIRSRGGFVVFGLLPRVFPAGGSFSLGLATHGVLPP